MIAGGGHRWIVGRGWRVGPIRHGTLNRVIAILEWAARTRKGGADLQ